VSGAEKAKSALEPHSKTAMQGTDLSGGSDAYCAWCSLPSALVAGALLVGVAIAANNAGDCANT